MDLKTLVLAAAVAALLELDVFAVAMLLISQPVVSGAIAGYIFGNLQQGLILGGIVQLMWINTPHVGAYVPPSASAIAFTAAVFSAVIGAGVAIVTNGNKIIPGEHSVMMFSLIIGVAMGYFVGQTDIWDRKVNTALIQFFENKIKAGKEKYVHLTNALAILIKFVTDFILYMVVFIFGPQLLLKIYSSLPGDMIDGLKIAYWMMPILGFAVIFDMFRTNSGAKYHGIVLFVSYILFFFVRSLNAWLFMLLLFLAGYMIFYQNVLKKKEAVK